MQTRTTQKVTCNSSNTFSVKAVEKTYRQKQKTFLPGVQRWPDLSGARAQECARKKTNDGPERSQVMVVACEFGSTVMRELEQALSCG